MTYVRRRSYTYIWGRTSVGRTFVERKTMVAVHCSCHSSMVWVPYHISAPPPEVVANLFIAGTTVIQWSVVVNNPLFGNHNRKMNLNVIIGVIVHMTALTRVSFAFVPTTTLKSTSPSSHGLVLASSSSRFEGNQRAPTAEELAIMDEMIDKLANAKPYELPAAVKRAFRIIRSPPFFLRIAERTDKAESAEAKAKLEALATNLVSTLEVVVETTEEQLDERAVDVETVVKAAAEPDSGEFMVPLTADRLEAMKDALKALPESSLDEGFLATLDSWIVKSHQDGMDLMVGILQKVLQMYAGLQITRVLERSGEVFSKANSATQSEFQTLLQTDADAWASVIATSSDVGALKKAVQSTMETVVLGLETGSMAQQVQAEYLKELLSRVEEAEAA